MAKHRARMPSVADMTPKPKVFSAYEAQVLGASKATDSYASAEEQTDPALWAAIEAYKNGDESLLLPYQPTPSINAPRPRTLAAGYDPKTQTLRVKFREGAVYEYHDVPPRVWRNFKRVKSPGRAINRVLNFYEYNRMDISG